MGHLSDSGSGVVRLASLDALAESREVPDPKVMKIDVEDAELSVLRGASRLLDRARPQILLATHGAAIHRDCCEFLRSKGYDLRPMEDTIASIDDTDEIVATPAEHP